MGGIIMTIEDYTKRIELPMIWADSRERALIIKAAILRTIRLVLKDPEQAKKYYNCQAMATMDKEIKEE